MSLNPAFVVRIDLAPLVGDVLTWKASDRPYATDATYEGLIHGSVVRMGDVHQSVCDRSGSPIANSFDVEVFDPHGFWRDLLAVDNTRYFTAQDLTLLFASKEAVLAESYPLTSVFRGKIVNPGPLPGRRFVFAAESRLGTKKAPYDNDSPVNKITAQRAIDDGFTGVSRDDAKKGLGLLWGEKTDKDRKNEFGEVIAKGACLGVNLGPIPGTEPEFLPKPLWAGYEKYLNGSLVSDGTSLGDETYTYVFGARTVDGQWSLSDPLTITGMPAADEFEKPDPPSGNRGFGTGVRLFGTPYSDPDHLAKITNPESGALMGNIWVKDGDESSTKPYRMMDAVDGELFTIGYDDNGDDSHYKLFYPGLPANPLAQINDEAGDFWCFLRHPGKFTQLFLKSMVDGQEAAYAQVGPSDTGVDLGVDGTGLNVVVNGHHYFGVRLMGARALAARDGTFPPRANLCGWHEDNDLSLPIINQAALIAQDVPIQASGGADGSGYQSGARLSIPNWSSFPAVPIVQTSRFQDTQDITKGFLSNALGYIGCVYFGPADAGVTWRQHWEEIKRSFGFDHFEQEHGQIGISVMDDLQSPTEGLLLREKPNEISRVLDAGRVVDNEIQNVEQYEYDFIPADNKFVSGVLTHRNSVSISRYGERPGRGVRRMRYVVDAQTAADVVQRFIADAAIGPAYPAILARFKKAITISLGRQYRLQHSDFTVSTEFPVYLRDRVISQKRGAMELKGRDRRGTYVAVVADDATPVWADATAEERATFMYVSDDDGLISGELAPRVR